MAAGWYAQQIPAMIRGLAIRANTVRRLAVAAAVPVLLIPAIRATHLHAQDLTPPRIPSGDPKSWESYFDWGAKNFRQMPTAAEQAFTYASRLDPSRAEPHFARYAAFFARSRDETIRGYFRGDEATLRRPDVLAADSARTRALMRNPFVHRGLEILIFDGRPGGFSDDRDTRAWIAYSNSEFKKAVDLLTFSIERSRPGARWRRFDRSLAYVAMGDNRRALADVRALLEEVRAQDDLGTVSFYESKHFLLYMIGLLHYSLREHGEARTAFQEALLEDASFAYANAGLAAISLVERKNSQAEAEYSLAVELAPEDGVLRLWYAQVLFDLRRYGDAEAQVDRAIALEPLWPAPRHLLGRIRERQGRNDEAHEAWRKYIDMSPANDASASALRIRLAKPPARSP